MYGLISTGGQQAIVLDLPPMVLHSGTQAHELGGGSGQLVVDLVTQQGLPFHKDMNDLLPGEAICALAQPVW